MAAPLTLTRARGDAAPPQVAPLPGAVDGGAVRRPATVGTALAVALLLLGGLIVAFGGYLFFGSGLQASRSQDVLYDQLQESISQAVIPVSGPIAAGTPLGVLEIPTIGVQQVFVEGSSSEQTMTGPGLKSDSVLPGQAGVSVLVGRRATFGSPFAHLDDLAPGDHIRVTTGQGTFDFVVDVVRTSDAPPSTITAVPSRLSLVTSDPAITPSRSLVVSAALQGDTLPRSTGTTAAADEEQGKGSSSHAVSLLLWSQLLLVCVGLVTWAAARLPRAGLWIGAAPLLLAILWNVFEDLAVLLPNTL